MIEWHIFSYLLITMWCVWITQAVLVVFQSNKFFHRVSRPTGEDYESYTPKCVVIVPFKGYDHDLLRHVRALLNQDYVDYRLVFVFEDMEDEAREHISSELLEQKPHPPIDIVFAGQTRGDTGQKVHNQLAALAFLDEEKDDSEVWVFADSDAVPGPEWLKKLVRPLCQTDQIGITTGYRWLKSDLTVQGPIVPSMFASVINSAVAMFIGHGNLTQAWGGSMAVRVDFAREHKLVDYLRGSLSDDYQMTRMCREANKRVYFVPHCLVPSPVRFDWGEFFEFARRQYLITRIHNPSLYAKAIGVVGFYLLANTTAVCVLVYLLITGRWAQAIIPGSALFTVGLCNQIRAYFRRKSVAAAFGNGQLIHMRHSLYLDRFGTFSVMAVNLILLLSAAKGNTISWRGIRYQLNGPQSITIIN